MIRAIILLIIINIFSSSSIAVTHTALDYSNKYQKCKKENEQINRSIQGVGEFPEIELLRLLNRGSEENFRVIIYDLFLVCHNANIKIKGVFRKYNKNNKSI